MQQIYAECFAKTNSAFDWNGQNLPEELCFYRNNKKWFVCVCHEKYIFIYNETEADKSFLDDKIYDYLKESIRFKEVEELLNKIK